MSEGSAGANGVAATGAAVGEVRVRLGVPGLDILFPDGVRPGSLIVIVGPPGAGKTLLAMQLLMEMHLAGDGAAQRAPRSLFFTSDQSKGILGLYHACQVHREQKRVATGSVSTPLDWHKA